MTISGEGAPRFDRELGEANYPSLPLPLGMPLAPLLKVGADFRGGWSLVILACESFVLSRALIDLRSNHHTPLRFSDHK